MNRIRSQRVAEEVAEALRAFPPGLRRRLEFDVFEGDAFHAGIELGASVSADGRSLRDTAHVCYPHHMVDKRTTVVLPEPIGVAYTVHELGHVLDFALDFDIDVDPVTHYAEQNRYEAFAEFVTAAFVPGYLLHDPRGERYVLPQRQPLALLGAV